MSEKCSDCDGAGWVVGIYTDSECCGRSEYECGGRGCTGPEQIQVQVQELCGRCLGTGSAPHPKDKTNAD